MPIEAEKEIEEGAEEAKAAAGLFSRKGARRTNALNALLFFFVGLMGTMTGALMPDIVSKYGLSGGEVGFLVAAWNGGFIAGSAATNLLLRVLTGPNLFRAAAGGASVAAMAIALASDFFAYVLALSCLALSCGALITLGHSVAARANKASLASGLSIAEFAIGMGYLFSPLFFTGVSVLGGAWESGLLALALLPLALASLQWRGRIAFSAGVGKDGSVRHRRPRADGMRRGAGQFWPSSALLLIVLTAVASLCLHYLEWGENTWNTFFVMKVTALNEDGARMVFSVFLAGLTLSRLANIFLARRFSTFDLSCGGVVTIAGALLLYAWAEDVGTILAANAMTGLGLGALLPNVMAMAIGKRPGLAPLISTAVIVSGGIGALLAGFALGAVVEAGRTADLFELALTPALALLSLAVLGLALAGGHRPSRISWITRLARRGVQ